MFYFLPLSQYILYMGRYIIWLSSPVRLNSIFHLSREWELFFSTFTRIDPSKFFILLNTLKSYHTAHQHSAWKKIFTACYYTFPVKISGHKKINARSIFNASLSPIKSNSWFRKLHRCSDKKKKTPLIVYLLFFFYDFLFFYWSSCLYACWPKIVLWTVHQRVR